MVSSNSLARRRFSIRSWGAIQLTFRILSPNLVGRVLGQVLAETTSVLVEHYEFTHDSNLQTYFGPGYGPDSET